MKNKVTLDAIVANLKEKVFHFEEDHEYVIDRENEQVLIKTTLYPSCYFGHVEWIGEVATYLDLTLTARVEGNEVVLVIY